MKKLIAIFGLLFCMVPALHAQVMDHTPQSLVVSPSGGTYNVMVTSWLGWPTVVSWVDTGGQVMRILPRPEAADPSATEFTTIMRITFSSNNSGTVKTGVITINAGVSSSPGGQTYPVVIDYRQE